jgi:hypothetical protein
MRFTAGLVLLAATGLRASGQSLTDTEFANVNWSIATMLDTTPGGNASCVGSQTLNGNPGNCRSIAHQWQITGPGVSIAVAHLRAGIAIAPASGPGIVSVQWSLQASCDVAPYVHAIGFGPVLFQDNKWFVITGGVAIAGAGWTTLGGISPTDSWVEVSGGPEKPDFSPTGGPLQFGFYSSNGGSGGSFAISAEGRIDNFFLRVLRTCSGDFNVDGVVDDADFQIFAVAYNILDCEDPDMPGGCPADLNTDGFVDDLDFQAFAVAYDRLICP